MESNKISHRLRDRKGFLLSEAVLAVAIMSILGSTLVPKMVEKYDLRLIEKTASEMHAIQVAAKNYRVATGSWPADIATMKSLGYLPAGWNAATPWGYSYNVSPGTSTFNVSAQMPTKYKDALKSFLPQVVVAGDVTTSSVTTPGSEPAVAGLLDGSQSFTGDITIAKANPSLNLLDTAVDLAVRLINNGGTVKFLNDSGTPTVSISQSGTVTTLSDVISGNNVVAKQLIDADNAAYFVDPSGVSNFSSITSPSINGSTVASGTLTIKATSNATTGKILLNPGGGSTGINTSTPAYPLDVNGQIHTSSGIVFSDATVQTTASPWALIPTTTNIKNTNTGHIFLSPTASGKVAIGQSTAPTEMLEVNGNINIAGTGSVLKIGGSTVLSTAGTQSIYVGGAGRSLGTTGTGVVGAGNNALSNLSTGTDITAIGKGAGQALASGASITLIGADTAASSSLANATAIGAGASVTGSNAVVLGRTTDNVAIGDTDPTANRKLFVRGSSSTTGYALFTQNLAGTTLFAIRNDGGIEVSSGVGTSGQVLTSSGGGSVSWSNQGVSDGNRNTRSGTGALNVVSTGTDNSGFGYYALSALTSGVGNSAAGSNAGKSLTSASDNVIFGWNAMGLTQTSSGNVAIGSGALYKAGAVTPGVFTDVVAIGRGAGSNISDKNVLQNGSIFIGAGADGTNGAYPAIAIGRNANVSGVYGADISIGDGSSSSYAGVAIGSGAYAMSGGVVVGSSASSNYNSGAVVIGPSAKVYAINATAIGNGASVNAANSTAIGYNAVVTRANSIVLGRTSDYVAIGATDPGTYKLLVRGTDSFSNYAFMAQNLTGTELFGFRNDGAFYVNGSIGTAGQAIISDGSRALWGTPTIASDANYNTKLGTGALSSNVNGTNNTAIGAYALNSLTNMVSNISSGNTAVGYSAAKMFNPTASGPHISAFGYNALSAVTTSGGNTAFGYNAGAAATSAGNTFIGDVAGAAVTSSSNITLVGSSSFALPTGLSYATAIGAGATVTGSNAVILGRASDDVAIGATDPGGVKLLVRGDDTSSSTYAFLVQDFYAANLFGVRGNGSILLNGSVGSAGQALISSGSLATYWGSPDITSDSNNNTKIGTGALASNTNSSRNTAIGYYALNKLASVSGVSTDNTAVGYKAAALFDPLLGGGRVTAIGSGALAALTTSGANTAVGNNAGAIATSAGNTFIGDVAGSTVTTSSNVTLLGSSTAASATGLAYATAIGSGATVTGSNAIVLGRNIDNVAIGTSDPTSTYKLLVRGDDSTNVKYAMMLQNFYGNVLFGVLNSGAFVLNSGSGTNGQALLSSGGGNVYWGSPSIASDINGNTRLGTGALANLGTSNHNTAIGFNALNKYGASAGTSNDNTVVGYMAGANYDAASGRITAFGSNALAAATTAGSNAAFGYNAGAVVTSAGNTFIGDSSGATVTTSGYVTLLGSSTSASGTGLSYATAIGAGAAVTSSNAVVLGRSGDSVGIGVSNPSGIYKLQIKGDDTTSSEYGLGVFDFSGASTLSVRNDGVVAVSKFVVGTTDPGANTKALIQGVDATSANTALAVKNNLATTLFSVRNDGVVYTYGKLGIGITDPGATNKFLIKGVDATSANYSLAVQNSAGTNLLSVRNDGVVAVSGSLQASSFTATSDARLKKNFSRINTALDRVLMLNGYTYDFKVDEYPDRNLVRGRQIGFKAQDLEVILPELVSTDKEGFKSVNYIGVIPVMVEAIKELNARVSQVTTAVTVDRTSRRDGSSTYAFRDRNSLEKLFTVNSVKVADKDVTGYISTKDVYLADKNKWASEVGTPQFISPIELYAGGATDGFKKAILPKAVPAAAKVAILDISHTGGCTFTVKGIDGAPLIFDRGQGVAPIDTEHALEFSVAGEDCSEQVRVTGFY